MSQTTANPYPTLVSHSQGNSGPPAVTGQLIYHQMSQQDSQFLTDCTKQRETIEEFMKNTELLVLVLTRKDSFQEYSNHKKEFEEFLLNRNLPSTVRQKQTEAGTQETNTACTNDASERDDSEEWPLLLSHPCKHSTLPTKQRKAPADTRRSPTQTVVLKPTCKEKVHTFTGRDIYRTMEKAGIQNTDGSTLHLNEKSKTIAITTRNPRLTSELLNIGAVEKAEKKYEMKLYMATSSNQVRGVIYLHGENLNETPESLMEGLDCRSNNIVTARIIGRSGKTVLITFEGERTPKRVRFLCEVFNVMEYRPRPVACYSCHHIGHKSNLCPHGTKRCCNCGHIHGDAEGCELLPKCFNCGSPHVATSNNCPKRQIPPRRPQPTKLLTRRPFLNGPPPPPRASNR